MPVWPPELDALIASPQHHFLVFENEHVRVLRVYIPAGERTELHTHQWPGVLTIKQASDVVRRGPDGEVTYDSRESGGPSPIGTVSWLPPLGPHTLENVGNQATETLVVEIKGAQF